MPNVFRHNMLCRPRSAKYTGAMMCILLALFVIAPAQAKDGRFEVREATSRLERGNWLVDARIDLELSKEAKDAIDNGVVITLQLQYEVNRRRRFWPDKTIMQRWTSIELRYMSLSKHYAVRYADTGKIDSYTSLEAALRAVGEVRDFELIGNNQLRPDAKHYFRLRAVLDRENLPGPLQILAFWRGDFSLESDWYRWKPG